MKLKSNLFTVYFLLFTFYCLLFTAERVSAEDFSVGLSPQIITIDAKAGESIKTALEIENFSNTPTTLSISIKEFTRSDIDDNQIKLLPPNSDFLTFSKQVRITLDSQVIEKIVLPAKTKKKLNISIDIPKEPKKKDFTFTFLFTSELSEDVDSEISLSRIKASIGTNFLVRIGDLSSSSIKIDKFSTNLFYERGPVPFRLVISNFSPHFITPTGTLKIRNMFGQMIGKIDLPRTNILSDSSKTYFSKDKYPSSKDKAVWWNEKFLLGIYSAELILTLPENDKSYTKKIHFLALPYQGMIIIFIIISFIFIIRKRVLHHLNR